MASSPLIASQDDPESKFSILVASDIHLGYGEKDGIRGNDSYTAFEEVLQIARERNVDFLLLGGDLFHENKPSSKAMYRCVQLLRKYCFGDKEIPFNIVSDQTVNFNHSAFPVVNYEDENLKVCLPVFSIHGNHDDPVGKEPICVLDTLSAMGLVNFFGKYVNIESIEVQPLLLEKEDNKVALYGIGAVPEERLHRMFLQKKVDFVPPDDSERWFKIFIVHQNRVAHGTKYLPEEFLGPLPDLVVWGHEHESFTTMDVCEEHNFFIYQPGSTVCTSLCPGEAAPKHIGLIQIQYDPVNHCNNFQMEPIPLKTTRRLICEDLNIDCLLSNRGDRDENELNEVIFEYVADKIQDLINQAAIDHSGHPNEPKEPSIRVRVEYSTPYHHPNPGLFGHRFLGKVANPKDLVLFRSKRTRPNQEGDSNAFDAGALDELMDFNVVTRCNIDDVIFEYFQNADEKNKLTLLSEKVMVEAIKEIVEKEQTTERLSQAIEFIRHKVHDQVTSQASLLSDQKEEISSAIRYAKELYMKDDARVLNDLKNSFANENGNDHDVILDDLSDDEDFNESSVSQSTSTRGRSRGRGSSSSTGRGRGRGRSSTQYSQSTLDSLVKVRKR